MITIQFLRRHYAGLVQLASNATRTVRWFHILKLASTLCTQFAALYLVYVLTPAEYGQFALIISVAQLMYVLTSGWSSGSVINLGSQSFAKAGSYKAVVYYRLSIVAMALVAVGSVFFLLRPLIEDYLKISGMFPYVLLLFLGYISYDHASQLLYPGNRDRTQAGAEFAATLTFLLIVGFVVKDLQSYVFAYAAISAVFACAVSVLFLKYFKDQPFHWRRTEFEAVLNYSAWQMIGVISIYLINMGTNYVLVICHVSLEQIGQYNLAYRLYSGFAPFFALFGILIPKWIHSSSAGVRLVHPKLLKIVCALAIFYLASGFALTPLLHAFEMQRYSESVPYFFWLFPAFLLTSYTNLLNTVIANTARFRRAQSGILLQCALLVVFSFPLVSAFGVGGAVAAITVASAAGAAYFNRIYRESLIQVKA